VADESAIEWTGATWSPVTGCTKVSPGCAHCYIERTVPFRVARRKFVGGTTGVLLHPERLEPTHNLYPARLRPRDKPIFVCSLADLFHEDVPDSFVGEVFRVMRDNPQRTFQVLTKRPERMRDVMLTMPLLAEVPLPNVWLGVSIENARYTWRADVLRSIPAAVRFVSAEPLLGSLYDERKCPTCDGYGWTIETTSTTEVEAACCGKPTRWGECCGEPIPVPVDVPDQQQVACPVGCWRGYRRAPLDLAAIDWVIAGGESGPGFRAVNVDHVRELRDACVASGTAFFFKQVGGSRPTSGGKLLDGREWHEMPGRAA
jgi:protein gp37